VLDIDKIALEQIQEGEERVEELADENEKINEKNEKNNEIIKNEKSDLDNTGAITMINDAIVNEKQQEIDNEKELIKQIQRAECIAETFENVKIFPILGNYI
jgi:hypothetical protein